MIVINSHCCTEINWWSSKRSFTEIYILLYNDLLEKSLNDESTGHVRVNWIENISNNYDHIFKGDCSHCESESSICNCTWDSYQTTSSSLQATSWVVNKCSWIEFERKYYIYFCRTGYDCLRNKANRVLSCNSLSCLNRNEQIRLYWMHSWY